MNIRALIAEDEPILAATLEHSLARLWPELSIVATCPNGLNAIERALALRPEVLFLDIKMPGKTGLEVAEELAEAWPAGVPFPLVVFVTAYDEFALAAIERDAADYVLKPVNDARLGRTVERLRQRLSARSGPSADAMQQLLAQMRALTPAPPQVERLTMVRAAVGNQVRMIPVAEVVYFEAVDKYVNVVTADGEALIRLTLKELLAQLDPAVFWQVHRGVIVNCACVKSAVRDESGKLLLNLRQRAEKLRVSPLYAHLFRQM
ncbi:LytTR family DNA-binding domain-containing protein [Massilia solisilvae]|uniref:LytTR family DNA-binding domain-containing protein n=1 Tax=Massilia solisilvae TaxID=1811225 RepID=A0ABT2BGY8_9BURK|nr:LytTR family DNA-binding domain-containing protein [Massilia solisilvae]MCS0607776.1 LytTR family DNA-binding domain-containing protein [Massilia solisilvae]